MKLSNERLQNQNRQDFDSVYFLKLSRIACQPPLCISIEFCDSASKVSTICVWLPSSLKLIFAFLPSSMVYSMYSFGFTTSYTPPKSKPELPSLASIRKVKLPPGLRSCCALGVCHSGEGLFHFVMSSVLVQTSHTFFTVAFTVVS